jgi:hypothetical protein
MYNLEYIPNFNLRFAFEFLMENKWYDVIVKYIEHFPRADKDLLVKEFLTKFPVVLVEKYEYFPNLDEKTLLEAIDYNPHIVWENIHKFSKIDLQEFTEKSFKSSDFQYSIDKIDFLREKNVDFSFTGLSDKEINEILTMDQVGKETLFEATRLGSKFSFKKYIKPIIDAQGISAFLYLRNINSIEANMNEEDLDFCALIAKKYGTIARNILEEIIMRAYKEKEEFNLSSNKGAILEYLNAWEGSPVVDFSLFEKFIGLKNGNDPEKIEEIKEQVEDIRGKIFRGKMPEKDFDNEFYPAVSFSTFPPAIGITKEQYLALNEERVDHEEHVPKELDDIQYFSLFVKTGSYKLEGEETLDLEEWKILRKIVKKVNSQKGDEKIDRLETARKILEIYRNKSIKEQGNKEWLYEKMYLLYRENGGYLSDSYDISMQGLMTYKIFVGENMKNDLIKKCLEELKEKEPAEFEKLEKDIQNRMKGIGSGDGKKVVNILNNIRKLERVADGEENTEERKKIDLRITKAKVNLLNLLEGHGISMEDIKGKSNEEILTMFATEDYDSEELVYVAISSALLKDTKKSMQTEIKKFAFVESGEEEEMELLAAVSKKKEHGVVGYNMGVCVAPDQQLWDDKNFMNAIIFDPKKKVALGGFHMLLRKGKLYLPGINPSIELLSKVDAEDLYAKLIDYAKMIQQRLNLSGIRIPTNRTIYSNRSQMHETVESKKYEIEHSETEEPFSYNPYEYSFSDSFIVL